MKDSPSRQPRLAIAISATMAVLFCQSSAALAQAGRQDRDMPAIYYFPQAQSTSAPEARPQVNGSARFAPQPGNIYPNQPGTPQGAGYPNEGTDQLQQSDDQQQVTFDTDVFCAAPDSSGKPRSEAWIRNCNAAAKVGPNAPSRKAREELLQ